MKKTLTNILIRISGFLKRISRLFRVFFSRNKSLFKYLSMGIVATASLTTIIILLSGINLDFSFFTAQDTPKPDEAISPSPIPVHTATPEAHIYGDSPLIILDCSQFNDNGFIEQTAQEFGVLNDLPGEYYKVAPDKFLDTYAQLVALGNEPNLVIAPNHLLIELGGFQDISKLNNEVLFNNAAKGAVRNDKIPIALKMYGYFFRGDLLEALSLDIPQKYDELASLGNWLRSDYAYDYLKYTEKDELKAKNADKFLTSRYGFGFPGGDVGGQLFIEQAVYAQAEGGSEILYQIQNMWEEIYLPPDTAYSSDNVIINAYMNDGLACVFAPGTLYERLFENNQIYYSTQVKPYLGNTPVFTANVIYCAVPENGDSEVVASFLSLLYNGGKLDKIIAQNHTAYLPISNFLNPGSPWKDALNEGSLMLYYENDYYLQVIKHIILAGEDVESALSKSIR